MALVGVIAIATGFPVIEVERGWAEVIAGATMLAGGLVTISLGLVLRTLLSIRQSMVTRPVDSGEAIVTAPHADALPHSVPQTAPAPTIAAPVLVAASATAIAEAGSEHPHGELVEPLHAHATPVEADTGAAHEGVAAPAPHAPAIVAAAAHEPPLHDATFAEPALHDAETLAPIVPEAAPHHADDGYELQSPSTPDHDLTPRPAPNDDWLDRAFSALDEEISAGTRPAERAAPALAVVHKPPAPVPPIAQPEVQPATSGATIEAEPLPAAAPHAPAPAAPATESAVIGRYESEGTSYIMFADGSIEAQSDAGIYRFRSMAELKAYIEG